MRVNKLKLYLKHRFNRNYTWRAEKYWEMINRVDVPQHIKDKLYVTGGVEAIMVQGDFTEFNMMRGDTLEFERYLFTFGDMLELVTNVG